MNGKDVYSYARVLPLCFRKDMPMHTGLSSFDDDDIRAAATMMAPHLVPPRTQSASHQVSVIWHMCILLRLLMTVKPLDMLLYGLVRTNVSDVGQQRLWKRWKQKLLKRLNHSILCANITGIYVRHVLIYLLIIHM